MAYYCTEHYYDQDQMIRFVIPEHLSVRWMLHAYERVVQRRAKNGNMYERPDESDYRSFVYRQDLGECRLHPPRRKRF